MCMIETIEFDACKIRRLKQAKTQHSGLKYRKLLLKLNFVDGHIMDKGNCRTIITNKTKRQANGKTWQSQQYRTKPLPEQYRI